MDATSSATHGTPRRPVTGQGRGRAARASVPALLALFGGTMAGAGSAGIAYFLALDMRGVEFTPERGIAADSTARGTGAPKGAQIGGPPLTPV